MYVWRMMELVIIIAFALVTFVKLSSSCPALCRCDRERTKLTCNNVKLTPDYLRTLVLPSSIKEVHLTNNGLSEVSLRILRPFRRVTKLVITRNPIENVPANTFQDFQNLTTLKLNNNRIREVQQNAFVGLANLLTLELQGNQLSRLYAGIFKELLSISSLKLMNNNIEEIPNDVFPSLHTLRVLFIGHNKITRLGDAAFRNMTMNRVGLAHNQIKTLTRSTFYGFKSKYTIMLYFNPLDCNCEQAMRYATYFKDMQNDIWGTCSTPPTLKGKSILTAFVNTECTKCDLNLCKNGGSCQGNKSYFNCTCSEQFKGEMCEHSICPPEIKYVTKYIQEPVTTVQKYSDIDEEKENDYNNNNVNSSVLEKKKSELETKLLILYAICSLELVIILCFVGLLILGKYQDWRLMQKYNKQQRSPHILEKFQNHHATDNPINGKGYISISELIPYKY